MVSDIMSVTIFDTDSQSSVHISKLQVIIIIVRTSVVTEQVIGNSMPLCIAAYNIHKCVDIACDGIELLIRLP